MIQAIAFLIGIAATTIVVLDHRAWALHRARIDWTPVKQGIGVCLVLNGIAFGLMLMGIWR
jgi:uncharacterized protein (DUF2062 family)